MIDDPRNIILVGMPGAGKSTVGVILAKSLTRPYLDSDILIQLIEKRSLQDIVDSQGHLQLRKIEERVLLDITCDNHVVATGGSAVYSHRAMTHMQGNGIIVFLDVTLATLKKRIKNYATRGLAKRPEQRLSELFAERSVLYHKYADVIVGCDHISQDAVVETVVARIQHFLINAPADY